MPIPCQIDQYIQILWDTFVHPETSCATAGEARQTIPTNYRDRVDEAQCTNNKCAENRKHRAHRLVERTS